MTPFSSSAVQPTARSILAYPAAVRKALVVLACVGLLTPLAAQAHLGEPTIKGLRFPGDRDERPWFIVDNVGLLALDGRWQWLCDEAMTDAPGLEDVAPVGDDGQTWLAATRSGLFRTTDGGCTFVPVEAFAGRSVGHLSPDPATPGVALVGTTTVAGVPNDVYRTTDGGATWQPAGLELTGRVRGLLRAEADPDVVYVLHTEGALRSEDGGRTFTPITLAPPPEGDELAATGTDVALLTTDPHDPRVVWSAVVRFPESDLIVSRDGGETWTRQARFPDDPRSLIIDPATGHLLLAMALEGLRRSTDDGETWDVLFLPEPDVWLDCLTRAPDGTVWACARRNAPYLVAVTDDLGDSWSGGFAADYTDVAERWACPDDSPTTVTCADACDRSREDCSAEVDAGVPMDAAPPPDAGETRTDAGGGCRAVPGESAPTWPTALAALAVWALSKRRRSTI